MNWLGTIIILCSHTLTNQKYSYILHFVYLSKRVTVIFVNEYVKYSWVLCIMNGL